MPGLITLVPPAKEPITLTDVKKQCHINHTYEDEYLLGLIQAARQQAEAWLSQSFITQTLLFTFDLFPVSPWNVLWGTLYKTYNPIVEIPQPPCQSISSITYIDLATGNTLAWTDYAVDLTTYPARLTPAWLSYYPIARPMPGSIQITFVAGYGNDPVDVPHCIRSGILELVATHYENRESVSAASMKPIPHHVEYLFAAANLGQL